LDDRVGENGGGDTRPVFHLNVNVGLDGTTVLVGDF
jgi:hypothetical protein